MAAVGVLCRGRSRRGGRTVSISITLEIPDELYEAFGHLLERCPDWDTDRAGTAALAMFLLSMGQADRSVSVAYINSVFSWRGVSDG